MAFNFFFRRTKEYSVSADRDEWVVPEETLVDSSSTLSDVELPVSENIFRAFYILTAVLALTLLVSVFRLGVTKYDYFAQISQRNRTVNVSVPPPRGIIMDRNGLPLVENVPSFDLLIISRQIQRNTDGTFNNIGAIAGVLGRNAEELNLFMSDGLSKSAVFFLATDIPRDQVLTLRTMLPSGFYLITSTKRSYTDGPQFSHLIGYIGKVSKADMTKDPYYLPSDTVGRLGVEASYEEVLRGTHGQLVFASAENTDSRPAAPGGNLVLSVDTQAQKQLFAAVFGILRESGLSQASAVVQDPRNGSVLAMVSFPTYDNNIFTGQLSQADVDLLFNNRSYPLLNRVIAGTYNPGSTIKPFIGMAALQEKVVSSEQVVNDDCIDITVPNPTDPSNPYVFKNWRVDFGPFSLRRAIADSCNVYFFTVGGGYGGIPGLGAERIVGYLKNSLADKPLGIDLPGEGSGFVPSPEWKYANKKEPWYQGDTYNISIGQGDLSVTPLWLNTYVSAIANGGTMWRPTVASRVVDEAKNTLTTYPPQELMKLPFSPGVIREMQAAMRQTVVSGTGKIFQDLPVTVAAKTGTAEVVKGQRINSLLVVYAPAEAPRVAMTVLMEGSASNQGYALRVAHQFLQWYFKSYTP